MDQMVIDLSAATDEKIVVLFPFPPGARTRARAGRRQDGDEFLAALASITASTQQIDATRAEIRQHAGQIGRNMEEFQCALAELERARDKVNQACAEALEEAARANRMRRWIERSARAMESGDVAEMERLKREEGDL